VVLLPARTTDDRLFANHAVGLCVVVFAAVPEVHVQDEQFDRAEATRRPSGCLLDELRTNVRDAVPAVVFTSPELAAVGTTRLEYMYGTCTCRTVQMADVPRGKAVKNTDVLVRFVKHRETDEVVGVHMVGWRAADMIIEARLAVKFGLVVDDIIDTIHRFHTFSEAFEHACQAFHRIPRR
jgi:hypothetical protein